MDERGYRNTVRRKTDSQRGFIRREHTQGMHVTTPTRRKALYDGLATLAGLAGLSVANGAAERPAREKSDPTDRVTPEHRQFEQVLSERVATFDSSERPTPGTAPAVPRDEVCNAARRHGWTDTDVEEHLETLKREGRVYQPCVGWIAMAGRRE